MPARYAPARMGVNGGDPEAEEGEVAVHRLAESTWEEVRELDPSRTIALLPVGAIEAHGPHLPLATDVIIAEGMAEAGAARLARRGLEPLLLPALPYTPAGFAADFPGTVDVPAPAAEEVVAAVAASLARHGLRWLAIANAHLDPGHLAALRQAAARAEGTEVGVIFPDVTRRPWATRLGEEFRSGACHAGRYEGSLVLALRPDLVREEARRALTPNPASLSVAIREGKRTFRDAGGPRAYFGWPADASPEEGERRLDELGAILEEAVLAATEATGVAER